jgi:3-phenylpropionate/trans-cinnamate dioxygenase ferredoxin reductase component
MGNVSETIVIVGAGHAAGQLVTTLRQQQFGGRIVLLGEEPYLPYQRPPLSKKYLAGEMPPERLYVKPATFFEAAKVDLRLGTRVLAIDREHRTVSLAGGDTLSWDWLVLATGSRARRLPNRDALPEGIHYLRGIADVDAIRDGLHTARNLVIIGAGYIGLEVAAVARSAGLAVCVVELADRVMSRVVSPEISAFYQQQHEEHGVVLRLSTGLLGFGGSHKVSNVRTSAGDEIPADLVVIGIGIVPDTELAARAGLAVADGILVDSRCRTSDKRIFAIGDCTMHPSALYGRRVRLESVQNALSQARTAATNICGGDLEYAEVPWFWSDQYDLKLQIAGLSQGYTGVILRGDPATRSFSCLYLKDGRLIAVDAVNSPRDFMQGKSLIAGRAILDPERAADVSVPLGAVAT